MPDANRTELIQRLSDQASHGSVVAQRMLGVAYLIEGSGNLDKALFWLKKASKQGDAQASEAIAHIYLEREEAARTLRPGGQGG